MIKNNDENYLLGLSTIADIHVMRKDFSQAIIYFDKDNSNKPETTIYL